MFPQEAAKTGDVRLLNAISKPRSACSAVPSSSALLKFKWHVTLMLVFDRYKYTLKKKNA